MERVAFLIEETNERLSCLLNPESLVLRRTAGVQPRRTFTGALTLAGLPDDPLLYTGGGRTELELELLFDIGLGGSSIAGPDVRDLTGPLWNLAENAAPGAGRARPPLVRFIWGKSWNIPAIVTAVAERLEYFTPAGVPQRSWLRLRLLRAAPARPGAPLSPGPLPASAADLAALLPANLPEAGLQFHEVIGGALPELRLGRLGLVDVPLELSVSEALITAAEIIGLALNESAAGQLLARAQSALSSAFERIGAQIEVWVQEIGESPALQAVSAALGEMTGSLASVARAARTRLVAAIHGAVAEIGSALEASRAALRTTADRAGQAIAGWLEPVWQEIRPVLHSMALAAAILGQAVRARASRLIAAASARLSTGLEEVRAALGDLSEAVSPRLAAAAQDIRSAVETISARLAQLRSNGQLKALANTSLAVAGIPVALVAIPAALAAIGVARGVLWAAGELRAARRVDAGLKTMSFTWKNAAEAAQAIEATHPPAPQERLAAPANALRTAAEGLRQAPERAAAPAIRRQLAAVEYSLAALRPSAPTDQPADADPGALAEKAIAEAQTSLAGLEAQLPARAAEPPAATDAEARAEPETGLQTEQEPLSTERPHAEVGVAVPAAEGEPSPAGESRLAAAALAVAEAIEAALAAVEAAWQKLLADRQAQTARLVQERLTESEPAVLREESSVSAAAGLPEGEPPGISSVPAAPSEAGPPQVAEAPRQARLGFGERLDQLAYRYYGHAAFWRLLAIFNELDDPLRLPAGRLLRVPPAALGTAGAGSQER